uniref:Uncharacterized protein n=1 Tax=Solanum tuberosum TaxID=4113 RepID=M1DRC7_SOLTU
MLSTDWEPIYTRSECYGPEPTSRADVAQSMHQELKDGTDPDAVVYGKRKKESVAELLITLLVKLFGRATPFQVGSETRNNIKDGNTTTLPCRDIKKLDQSKESQKGIQSAIPYEPITKKINSSIEGWEGLLVVNCGKLKGLWSTEGWEVVRAASWGQPKEDGGPRDSPW